MDELEELADRLAETVRAEMKTMMDAFVLGWVGKGVIPVDVHWAVDLTSNEAEIEVDVGVIEVPEGASPVVASGAMVTDAVLFQVALYRSGAIKLLGGQHAVDSDAAIVKSLRMIADSVESGKTKPNPTVIPDPRD